MIPVTSSIEQQISSYVDQVDELLDALRKQDADRTAKQLNELIIEYIEKNIENDIEAAKGESHQANDGGDQINAVRNKYTSDIQNSIRLEDSLKAIKKNPAQATLKEEAYLQSVIAALKEDLKRGDMSDLPSLIQG